MIIVDSAEDPAEQLSTSLTLDENNTIVLSEVSKQLAGFGLNDDIHHVNDIKEVLKNYGVNSEYLEDPTVRRELFRFLRQLYPIFRGGLTDDQKKSMIDTAVSIGAGAISAATGLLPGITRSVLQLIADVAWDRYLARQIEDPKDEADKAKSDRRRKSLDSRVGVVEKDQKREIVRRFIRNFILEAGVDREDLKEILRDEVAAMREALEDKLKMLSEEALLSLERKLAEYTP